MPRRKALGLDDERARARGFGTSLQNARRCIMRLSRRESRRARSVGRGKQATHSPAAQWIVFQRGFRGAFTRFWAIMSVLPNTRSDALQKPEEQYISMMYIFLKFLGLFLFYHFFFVILRDIPDINSDSLKHTSHKNFKQPYIPISCIVKIQLTIFSNSQNHPCDDIHYESSRYYPLLCHFQIFTCRLSPSAYTRLIIGCWYARMAKMPFIFFSEDTSS
jgi:hypothetical protein